MADVEYIPGAGKHTYGDPLILPNNARVIIGKYCSLSPSVEFNMLGDHNVNWTTSYPFHNIDCWEFPKSLRPLHREMVTTIGNDVWLGYGCKILHGVTIGDGAVIGAYAVVAKDVRPYAIVVGNPAREVKRRLPDDVVEFLLQLKWWDWPEEVVRANLESLLKPPDVEALKRIAAGIK